VIIEEQKGVEIMDFGEKLQALRKENGMSQEALAEKINVSRQAISKWELGTASPDTDNIVLLCKYFQVPIEYMLLNEFNDLDEYNLARGGSQTPAQPEADGGRQRRDTAVIIGWVLIICGVAAMVTSVFLCYPYQLNLMRTAGEAYTNALHYLFAMPIVLVLAVGCVAVLSGFIMLARNHDRRVK